jgi:ABC-2 type transport system ATP-binding protein
LRKVSKEEVDELLAGYADFFNDEILNKKKYIRDLSKGNQKKVGVVATFIGAADLLILDEPFANLDPTTQIRLKELLTEKGKDINTTILISSHDIQHVTDVCERITVLEKGEIVKDLQTTAKTLKELEAFFTK